MGFCGHRTTGDLVEPTSWLLVTSGAGGIETAINRRLANQVSRWLRATSVRTRTTR